LRRKLSGPDTRDFWTFIGSNNAIKKLRRIAGASLADFWSYAIPKLAIAVNMTVTIDERLRLWEEMITAPVQRCLIFDPIDFEVDFEVAELTASEKAQRRWRCEVIVKHGG
jgi:hypothetical protein